MDKKQEEKSEKQTIKLTDLPIELIFLIAKELDPKSEARLGATSAVFKKLKLGELGKKRVTETLMNLNHHDLYFLAKENEATALLVATTPALAEKLNQTLYSDYLKMRQKGYFESQYEEANCLDKTGKRYEYEIENGLVFIAVQHPKVAAIVLDKNYQATTLSDPVKAELQRRLERKATEPKM